MTDRDVLLAGVCPVCRAGPFRVPLQHVARVHGLPGRAARLAFGCALTETVCSPEHSELRRDQSVAVGKRPPPWRTGRFRCAACGVTFEARAWRDDDPGPRYCSKRCKRRGPG